MREETDKMSLDIVPESGNALVQISSSREVAEAQAAIVVAKRFPRDEKAALDKMLIACQRQALAESAIYSYARGGTDIQGPSIRLAETMIRLWGNVAYGIRELEQNPQESRIETFAIDLETNVKKYLQFTVKHTRTAKKTTYQLTDSRDIYENTANFGARRLRACMLALLPADIVETAVAECEKTMKTTGDTSDEALKKLVDAFSAFKVTREQIEARIQRRIETITPSQLVSLRKIYYSLKDGMSGVGDWFELPPDQQIDPSASLKEKLKAIRSKTETLPATENATTVPEVETEQGDKANG